MEELHFRVQGSGSEPYRVTFIRASDTELLAYCSCPAGENGQYCKHRLNLLQGLTNGIVSGNDSDVALVQSWLSGTTLEGSIARMRELEASVERLKRELSSTKKEVARAMRG
jgi:hypothetical protein